MALKLSDEALARKKHYNQDYAKKNFKCKNLQFNTVIPEDIALFDWVKSQKEGGTAYIKRLIREDMERTQKEKNK